MRGARSLDDALDLLPGVNVRTGGNGSPRIDVRGYRTRQVKLRLNGVPFGKTFDGQFDPTLNPSENIARIKLTTGAISTFYGDGAVGAVINVITRQAELGQSATTHAEYGSGDYHRVHGSYAWGNGQSGVFVAGGRSARGGYGAPGTVLDDDTDAFANGPRWQRERVDALICSARLVIALSINMPWS